MNKTDKEQIKSMLYSLTEISYEALTEVRKLKNELDDDMKRILKGHEDNLKMRIEELFTES